MIKGGKGGHLTKSGLKFESRVDLKSLFVKLKCYSVKGNELFFKDQLVAQMYQKHDFYKHFLSNLNVDWKKKISKKLLPDDSIFIISKKTIFIVEVKFQKVNGSVDQDLQTCRFKKQQYVKLLNESEIDVEYVYILSNDFKKLRYKDILKYIHEVGCYYFFEQIPLNFFGLPVHSNG